MIILPVRYKEIIAMSKIPIFFKTSFIGFLLFGVLPASFTGFIAYQNSPASSANISLSEQISSSQIIIEDPHDVLTVDQEEKLREDSKRIKTLDEVQNIVYLIFEHNDVLVNDTVENYMREYMPQYIGKNYFADGVLIVGVGLDPRQAFVFSGEDVAKTFRLRSEDTHLEQSIDAMKTGIINGNIPAGLFASASQAVDVDRIKLTQGQDAFEQAKDTLYVGGFLGLFNGYVIGAGIHNRRERRRKKLQEAIENKHKILSKYTELYNELDSIDIRANSLESGFIDKTLRSEWEEVRDAFLLYNDVIHGVNGIGTIDEENNKNTLIERSDEIKEVADTVDKVDVAKDNINRLFEIERGDVDTRKYALREMCHDMLQAKNEKTINDSTRSELEKIIQKTKSLMNDVETPSFLQDFALVLDEYNIIIERVKKDVEENLEIPIRVDNKTFHVYDKGYGYANRYAHQPYGNIRIWRRENIRADREYREKQSRSSSTNSSFSSGFSGSGGSSRF